LKLYHIGRWISRGIDGNELAIYESGSLLQWNIWGLDNVGKIDSGGLKYFYLKDHLGSIRVIMDENPAVVFAEDYDAWGYGLEERNYAKDNSMYKFTGKERDKESEYDYFGARYYDARIGRWGQVEPLLDKYINISPYGYGLNNPVKILDVDGFDLVLGGNKTAALNDIKSLFTSYDIQERITADENGLVSFDVSGLDLSSDAALELVYNLVTSEDTYLFEVSNNTYGIASENSVIYNIGDAVFYNLSEKGSFGNVNFSKSARNINGGVGYKKEIPKDNFSGQVTLGTGNWTVATKSKSKVFLPRSDIVFHELSENYHRTHNKEPYIRKDYSGAHKRAVDDAARYKNQIGKPAGEVGRYVP